MAEKKEAPAEMPQKAPMSVPSCANGVDEGAGMTRDMLRVSGNSVPMPTASP